MSKRKHHRGRRKKNNFLLNIILVIAVIVFCVSGYNLLKIGKGYKDGQNEYEKIRKLAVTQDKDSGRPVDEFQVDFDKLKKINADTLSLIHI